MTKFHNGQRVVFQDVNLPGYPAWFHAASWGDPVKVMHLNARDNAGRIKPITGTILRVAYVDEEEEIVTYGFRPDGWPEKDNGFTGFQIDEEYFSPLLTDEVTPGTITDRRGKPIAE